MSSADGTIAITYRRVSTYKQERDGVSLDVQTDQCLEYIRGKAGWRLGGDFSDTLSGRTARRRDYQRMLEEVRTLRAQGKTVVIVTAALDRMGRDLKESVRARGELKLLQVPLHALREGGVLQELQADVYASIAADESRRIAARVKGSQTKFRGHGWRTTSRAPWGYVWVESTPEQRLQGAPKAVLRPDPETASYAREAWERTANGETVHQVTKWVAGLSSPARGGRVLRFANVLHMLKNPAYIGRVEDPTRGVVTEIVTDPATGELVEKKLGRRIPTPDLGALALPAGRHKALVSDETWVAVHKRLAGHVTMPRQASGQYLLSGLLRCPKCGLRMQGRAKFGGTVHQGYSCATPGLGCWYGARAATIDAAVLEQVARRLEPLPKDARLLAEMRQEWARLQRPPERPGQKRLGTLERTITRARKRQDEMLSLLADRVITRERYDRGVDVEQADIDAAELELAEIRQTEAPPILLAFDDVLRALGDWPAVLNDGPITERRDTLVRLIERIIPVRVGYGRYKPEITWTPLGVALGAIRKPSV